MAYRRSLTTTVRLIARQRFAPSFSCTHHENDHKDSLSDEKVKSFLQCRSYSNNTSNTWLGFGGDPKRTRFLHVPMTTSGFLLARRNMSTTNGHGMTMEVMSSQATAVNEVAVAAADSWPPVAVLQYAIDGIHIYTGLNWWASLVITTLVIRTLSIPLMINQHNIASKLISLSPELARYKREMQDRDMSPTDVAERQEQMERVYKEHGIGHFTRFKSLFIQGPVFVSFFLAIQNMVEKVPSFQTGGTSWFIDLTTTDSFYILPFLTAFSFWVKIESITPQGSEVNPADVTMKNVLRGLSALMIPVAATFPNALLCCWIISNFFSLVYGQIIKRPSVKKLLNINIIEHPTHQERLAFSLELWEKYAAARSMQQGRGETNPTIRRTQV